MNKKLNSRSKGQRGERAVIDWLQPVARDVLVTLACERLSDGGWLKDLPDEILLQRNTLQSDQGGSDISGLPWLAAEVKNCEQDNPAVLGAWWEQCQSQAKRGQTPVLFYKRAHRAFRIRMPGGCGDTVWLPCVVDISVDEFEKWFREKLRAELLALVQK